MRGILALGIFLITLSAAILIFGLVPPTNEPIGEFLAGFVCEANEDPQLISNTNQDLLYYCVDGTGNRRDISGWVIGALTVLYLVPFTAGLAMTIYAGTTMRRRQFDVAIQELIDSGQLSQQSADIFKKSMGMQGRFNPAIFAQAITANSYGDLSSRLKQLDDALDKGLVSKDEYERARESLLRNFTEA